MFAQNEQLALDYVETGEYEKAITLLEAIIEKQPTNYYYFEKLLTCYQQTEQFEKALALVQQRIKRYKQPQLIIEEGYIYQLQGDNQKAEKKYQEALSKIYDNPNYAYNLGATFQNKTLLSWALQAYELGQKENPNLNFDYQTALIYGQMGNIDGMTNKLLDYAYSNQNNTPNVQNYFSRFLNENTSGTFQNVLKKALLIRTQKTPDVYWNEFLSWFYVQQKEFSKAFIQEKAVYRRNPETLNNIIALGQMAIEDNQKETAQSIFSFILENTQDIGLQIKANEYLMKIKIEERDKNQYPKIKYELNLLLKQFGISPYSLNLQLLTANFECFYLNNPDEASQLLDKSLELPLNPRQIASVKLELADILLYSEKFNQAILYYAQVEDNMKNDEMAHEASMKMAKANYFKNDFDWALQQVKVLKQSSSLLIANDALELFLLIQDNSVEDSLRKALTAFSKADLKLYQKKKNEALKDFKQILTDYKDDSIADETLLKIGKIQQDLKQYTEAIASFNEIIEKHAEGVFVDEALYFSAEIYRRFLDNPEKAKALYEKIIFNHQDSIYFTESQRQYRLLRGDTNI